MLLIRFIELVINLKRKNNILVVITFSKLHMKKKRILILVDSFKGSLTSKQASSSIEKGIFQVTDNYLIRKISVADGGEGTLDSLLESLKGQKVKVKVSNPLGRIINSYYGFIDNGNTAIIELAKASGITLLKKDELDILNANTYGTGEMILDAINNGAKNIYLAVGGSATNDCGIGMLSALGVIFFDINGNIIEPKTKNISKIKSFDTSNLDKNIKGINFTVIFDVTNPLCGKNGASLVYGIQKGADSKLAITLDRMLYKFSKIVENHFGLSFRKVEGSGAAGGIGFAAFSFLNAKGKKGIQFLTELLNLEEEIKKSDIIITGEGKIDSQTLNNKLPIGIAKLSKSFGKKVYAFCGTIEKDSIKLFENYFDGIYPISNIAENKIKSIENASEYLTELSKIFAKNDL